jgi:mono/diheme cytochrome c family protein
MRIIHHAPRLLVVALYVSALATCMWGQEPSVKSAQASQTKSDTTDGISAAALAGSKQDPAAFKRGSQDFAKLCSGCHGVAARGGPGAPDLVRSLLVLDDEKGILIAPVLREGRPDKGMPNLGLTEPQISDLVAWLHVQTYAAGHRGTYIFGNVVTGDRKKGEVYFNTVGKCNTCHSVTGDLAGIGAKYQSLSLQSRWLQPRAARRRSQAGGASSEESHALPTVTVTLPSGQSFSGALDHIDDFTVALRESSGEFHSFTRNGATPKVEVHDPLQAHTDMLGKYTDADIHNVTAYLVTLK